MAANWPANGDFSKLTLTRADAIATAVEDLGSYLAGLGYDSSHQSWMGSNLNNYGWTSVTEVTSSNATSAVTTANNYGVPVNYTEMYNALYSTNPVVPIQYSKVPPGTWPLNISSGYVGASASSDLASSFRAYAGLSKTQCGTLGKASAVVGLLAAAAVAVTVLTGGTAAVVAGLVGAAWGVDATGADLPPFAVPIIM